MLRQRRYGESILVNGILLMLKTCFNAALAAVWGIKLIPNTLRFNTLHSRFHTQFIINRLQPISQNLRKPRFFISWVVAINKEHGRQQITEHKGMQRARSHSLLGAIASAEIIKITLHAGAIACTTKIKRSVCTDAIVCVSELQAAATQSTTATPFFKPTAHHDKQ